MTESAPFPLILSHCPQLLRISDLGPPKGRPPMCQPSVWISSLRTETASACGTGQASGGKPSGQDFRRSFFGSDNGVLSEVMFAPGGANHRGDIMASAKRINPRKRDRPLSERRVRIRQ